MIAVFGFTIGAGWGVFLARKRGGNRLDMLQYGASLGIAFALLGTFVGFALARLLSL